MANLLAALPVGFNAEIEDIQTAGKAFEPTAARCTCTTIPCCCWDSDNDVSVGK